MKKDEFEAILYADVIDFSKKDTQYGENITNGGILVEFIRTPYEILIEKMKGKVHEQESEEAPDKLYIRYKDTGESWELGYVKMSLSFWKFLDAVFYNFKPSFYRIRGDKLVVIKKGDLLLGEKFLGSELDAYIE